MKVLAAIVSVWVMAAAQTVVPAPAGAATLALDGTTPGDDALMFRKYRGDDEVGDRDHSGKGRGRGRGRGDDGGDGGGGDHSKAGDGKKHGGSGGSGSQGGRSNSHDDADRFGR